MDQAWLDRPKEVYQWIQNEYQPPVVMLLDPDTSQPTANIPRMDEILHASWDQVMRKYADTPEPDVRAFAQKYDKFLIKGVGMQTTPISGSRLAKCLRKMGVYTATGMDGWCVLDLLLLPTCLLDMLSQISSRRHGHPAQGPGEGIRLTDPKRGRNDADAAAPTVCIILDLQGMGRD